MVKEWKVVLFPWLAFGHMLPYLELAKSLAKKGALVSFVTTPGNILRLPPIPSNLEARIKAETILLPLTEGLEEESEATIDIPLQEVQYLKKACDHLEAPFEEIIRRISPDLIIYDFVLCWVPKIATKFAVPSTYFSVFSAATLAFLGSPEELKSATKRTRPEDLTIPPEWFNFFSSVAHQGNHAVTIFNSLNFPDASGLSSGQRFARTIEDCDFVTVRSCRRLEGEYLRLLEQLYQKPVFPLGLLPPCLDERTSKSSMIIKDGEKWASTYEWLDKQRLRSVVFVGFGSEYKITLDEIHELAFGLELSRLPFIWVLRQPTGINKGLNLFPQGFSERILGQGIIYVGWAPQKEILTHPAIGGCLFHSGWGSAIESLHNGHALILLPRMADQGLNARLLVDMGVGFEVERGEDGWSFTRAAVAKSMRHVMLYPAGEPLRQKARQMGTFIADDKYNESYMEHFLHYLENKYTNRRP